MSFHVRRISEPKKKRDWSKHVIKVLNVARPLLHLYGDWKDKREHDRRTHMMKRALLVMIAVFCVFLLLTGIAKAILAVRGMSVTSVISIAGTTLERDSNGHTNFLLMGQGHKDHDGKDLTDTIIIASVDPENTESVVLLSLPRDLYFLKTEKMGKGRLNSLYRDYKSFLRFQRGMTEEDAALLALQELKDEIGRKLELPIHYAVKIDFIAFVRVVDVLGGVDIDVPYDIIDLEYPDENFGYEPFELKEGLRHLDGETALKYARSRNTTSDFGRSARQQQLIAALGEKAKKEGMLTDPSAITSLMKIMSENVETTMSLREIVSAAALGEELDRSRILTMQLSDRNALYDSFIEPGGFLYTPPRELFDGASVLLPISIPEFPVTWKQIRTLKQIFFDLRTPFLARPKISILNAGAAEGTARRLGNELIRYGFDVVTIANASTGKSDTSLLSAGVDTVEDLAMFFGTLLQIPIEPLPTDLRSDQRQPITIILGHDYGYTPLQDLLSTDDAS